MNDATRAYGSHCILLHGTYTNDAELDLNTRYPSQFAQTQSDAAVHDVPVNYVMMEPRNKNRSRLVRLCIWASCRSEGRKAKNRSFRFLGLKSGDAGKRHHSLCDKVCDEQPAQSTYLAESHPQDNCHLSPFDCRVLETGIPTRSPTCHSNSHSWTKNNFISSVHDSTTSTRQSRSELPVSVFSTSLTSWMLCDY